MEYGFMDQRGRAANLEAIRLKIEIIGTFFEVCSLTRCGKLEEE